MASVVSIDVPHDAYWFLASFICKNICFQRETQNALRRLSFITCTAFDFGGFAVIGPINLLSNRLLRYVLIFEYQILVLDLVVDIRTKISEGI